MQIVFDDGSCQHEVDVRVNDPGATVADLADALDPTGAAGRTLHIGERAASPDLGLGECGLHEGAVVRLTGPGHGGWDPGLATPATDPGQARSAMELAVVNGLDAGRRFPLPSGVSTLGRDHGCDVVLHSATVSRRHATVTAGPGASLVLADLGSHNGTWVQDEPVAATAPIGEEVGFQLGALQIVARRTRRDDRPVAVDPLRHASAAGTIAFNRPPRSAPPSGPPPIALPAPPKPPSANVTFNVVAFVAPLVIAPLMYVFLDSVVFLAFAMLSPIMVVGNYVQGRRRATTGSRKEQERFGRELAAFRTRLVNAVAEEVARRDVAYPDPSEVQRRATLPSVRLWERRPGHHDVLMLRAGVGPVPWQPPVEEGRDLRDDVAGPLSAAGVLASAAVTVDISGGGVVGIVGPRPPALALARSLVLQAAVHHGPADLPIAVFTRPEASDDWDWAKWLPHTRDAAAGGARLLSGTSEHSTRMAEAWLQPADARAGRRERDHDGATLLAVVDDESLTEGRRAPVRTLLRGGAGPVAGIVLASTSDRLPAVCTTVIELDGPDGAARLHRPQLGELIEPFLVCGLADDVARAGARALARFEDPELGVVGAGLPDTIRLLPLLELDELDAEAVTRRWKAAGPSPRPVAPIGVTEDGVFVVDLHADGPHGLVAGTTGSGKSELLRTLVASLAAGVSPEHLTFVLIDFKGGSAFDQCSLLPHTVGMVTDLDEHLAERALRCLEAELKHRERLLRTHRATDITDYQRGRAPEPLPRLVVLVDEFATLKAELPEFVDALVGVAQRGRSLGMHLILATQRPSGAVSENIKANTNLRIALRVQDRSDSTDVIDVGDAAAIGRAVAGRAYVRLGPGEVVAIQTALATGTRTAASAQAVDVTGFRFGPTARAPEQSPHGAPGAPDGGATANTDLGLLVAAITEAFVRRGRPLPRRPWPEPLPDDVDLAVLTSAPVTGPPGLVVPFALADDPDAQSQYPIGWRPADGNLVVYGIGGSGTTTALATLALGIAGLLGPDRVHLYVLDFGAGELAPLAGLPHTGAVIGAGERERQMRLVRYLRSELDRRRDLGGAQRSEQPLLVVFLDGYSAFNAEFKDVLGMALLDDFTRVFADGPEVGIHVVASGDRSASVPSALSSLVRQKFVLRLADAYDYGSFGVPSKSIPALGPGRGIMVETNQVVQIARPADGLAGAVARLAGRRKRVLWRGAPAPVGQLPTNVALARIPAMAELDQRPWRIPFGIGERTLGPVVLSAYDGEHALVAGPARSGKSTTLATMAAAAKGAAAGALVIAVAGPRSPLPGRSEVDHHLAPSGLGGALAPLIDGARRRPVLVLVDDAETVDDGGGMLTSLLTGHGGDVLVVAAGRAEVLRGLFNHWTKLLRRSKLGVLLRPNVDLDGELLGVALPRRSPVAMTVGRGYLVASGDVEIVQVATPDALEGGTP